jgi:hypothetical protein
MPGCSAGSSSISGLLLMASTAAASSPDAAAASAAAASAAAFASAASLALRGGEGAARGGVLGERDDVERIERPMQGGIGRRPAYAPFNHARAAHAGPDKRHAAPDSLEDPAAATRARPAPLTPRPHLHLSAGQLDDLRVGRDHGLGVQQAVLAHQEDRSRDDKVLGLRRGTWREDQPRRSAE